jgi:hypothetical protein
VQVRKIGSTTNDRERINCSSEHGNMQGDAHTTVHVASTPNACQRGEMHLCFCKAPVGGDNKEEDFCNFTDSILVNTPSQEA